MPTLGFHHVNFHVAQPLLEDMKNFYCDVMGLQPGFRPALKQHGYWLYAEAVPVVHLFEAVGKDVRQTGVTSVYDHVAFHCTDLQDVLSRLERLGVPYQMMELPHSGQTQIAVTDPAGHKVEFMVEPGATS
jgi:catechol 2,3-dioxygenase-like lactoylglutathione lyase family enzyme